jgi:cysteine synthase A
MRAESILDTIGNTPHLRLRRLFPDAEVWVKLERSNPGGSIKDRIGIAMVEDAERRGTLRAGGVIVEPTSGNTGIGLAMVAAVKGYRLIIVMPESASVERRRVLTALGAELDLTPREKGMRGAIERAQELVKATPGAWMPQQFENAANVEIHRRTTAREILDDFPDGVDALITGVGTGGHITGVGRALKERFPRTQVLAVEPTKSAVLSGGEPSPHKVQGIGAGFIPAILDRGVLDGIVQISEEEAFEYAVRAARQEALFVGPSSGGALAAVAKTLPQLPKGSRVLTFCYDTGERYLSVEGLF